MGTFAVTSYSVTSIISLPCIWGGPDKGKHQLFQSCPGVILVSRASKCKTRRQHLLLQVGSFGSFRIAFLRLQDLAPVTSLSTCAPLATSAHFLASVAAVKSLPSLATPSAPNPLGYCSNLCRKECTTSLMYSIEGEIFSTTP